MLIAQHAVKVKTTVKDVWNLWAHESQWPLWDKGITHVDIQGFFQKGTPGVLKLANGRARSFTIYDVQVGKGFTLAVPLGPLMGSVHFSYSIVPDSTSSVHITHEIHAYGPAGLLVGSWNKKQMQCSAEHTVEKLASLCGKRGKLVSASQKCMRPW